MFTKSQSDYILEDAVKNLQKNFNTIRDELDQWKPTIGIDINFDDRTIETEIKQNNQLLRFFLDKEVIDYYSIDEQASILVNELSVIYRNKVEDLIKERLILLNENIKQLKQRNQW